jgi:hypothetical protein
MDKEILEKRLEELTEAIRNFNNSNHNYSYPVEMYIRDLFDMLIDDIKN